jgi:PKD repeat protein
VVSEMESQHADGHEELLLELRSKNTTRSIKDFSAEGISLESNLEGEAKGVYNATFYATITMLVKPDRTINYEARQIHTTSDGDTVLVYYKGKSIIESPTQNKFVGETTFQTGSKKLAWLNGVKARHEGEYDPVAGENDFQIFGRR